MVFKFLFSFYSAEKLSLEEVGKWPHIASLDKQKKVSDAREFLEGWASKLLLNFNDFFRLNACHRFISCFPNANLTFNDLRSKAIEIFLKFFFRLKHSMTRGPTRSMLFA